MRERVRDITIAFFVIIVFAFVLWALPAHGLSGADSTNSQTRVVQNGQNVVIRPNASIRLGAVTPLGTRTNAIVVGFGGTILPDTTRGVGRRIGTPDSTFEVSADTLRTAIALITKAVHSNLNSVDSTYQAWPADAVIDSAGNGNRITTGTISVNNKSIIIKTGTYAATTVSGGFNIISVRGRLTLSDSLLITGNDNNIDLGPSPSIGGVRISGSRNKLTASGSISAGALLFNTGANDNYVNAGGWGGSGFTVSGASGKACDFRGSRNVLEYCYFNSTGASGNGILAQYSDSSSIRRCKIIASGSSGIGVATEGPFLSVSDCYIYALGTGGRAIQFDNGKRGWLVSFCSLFDVSGAYFTGDAGAVTGNVSDGGQWTITAGADSTVYGGNTVKGGISNSGTSNLVNQNISR